MNAQETSVPDSVRRVGRKWRIIVGINLSLGLMLWFGYCTDYSWVGTVPDYCFPPGVALVSLLSLMSAGKCTEKRFRRLCRLACMPSLIGGGLAVVLMVIMIIPPFTLGFFFRLSEIEDETLMGEWGQSVISH